MAAVSKADFPGTRAQKKRALRRDAGLTLIELMVVR